MIRNVGPVMMTIPIFSSKVDLDEFETKASVKREYEDYRFAVQQVIKLRYTHCGAWYSYLDIDMYVMKSSVGEQVTTKYSPLTLIMTDQQLQQKIHYRLKKSF